MPENNAKSAIEALLFASDRPLTMEQIMRVLDGLDAAVINGLLTELKNEYEQSNRGVRLVEIAGGYQIVTFAGFAPFLKKLFKERCAQSLSKPSLETLAIIAYKQPVTRLEIALLRNVNIDGVMASLMDKNLIRITGRKKVPGRPFVYGTTRFFLERFGLKSLEELPKTEELKDPDLVNKQQEPINPENPGVSAEVAKDEPARSA
jgi:segregation and condensation protein B